MIILLDVLVLVGTTDRYNHANRIQNTFCTLEMLLSKNTLQQLRGQCIQYQWASALMIDGQSSNGLLLLANS